MEPRPGALEADTYLLGSPGAGIVEADDRQVTTVFSPTVIPPSALDKPSIMKRYHRWQKTR